ncbi:hypothetical protein VIGAN_06044100, partial [Vigna angularis var. angularis]
FTCRKTPLYRVGERKEKGEKENRRGEPCCDASSSLIRRLAFISLHSPPITFFGQVRSESQASSSALARRFYSLLTECA